MERPTSFPEMLTSSLSSSLLLLANRSKRLRWHQLRDSEGIKSGELLISSEVRRSTSQGRLVSGEMENSLFSCLK